MTTHTETNLRIFMRQCQQFWLTQWINKPSAPVASGSAVGSPSPVTYELSLVGVYADMRAIIGKPNIHFVYPPHDIITEDDCRRVFNTEFSDPWDDVKQHYVPGQVLPYPIIPNYHPNH